jgi:hypothetical protein
MLLTLSRKSCQCVPGPSQVRASPGADRQVPAQIWVCQAAAQYGHMQRAPSTAPSWLQGSQAEMVDGAARRGVGLAPAEGAAFEMRAVRVLCVQRR